MGVFARIMIGLVEQAPDNTTISIDATYLKAYRAASILRLKKGGRLIGLTKGGMNTKLHAVTPSHDLHSNHCRAMDTSGVLSACSSQQGPLSADCFAIACRAMGKRLYWCCGFNERPA